MILQSWVTNTRTAQSIAKFSLFLNKSRIVYYKLGLHDIREPCHGFCDNYVECCDQNTVLQSLKAHFWLALDLSRNA